MSVREWRGEMNRDPAVISTALDVLREQNKQGQQEEEPGAGGPSRRTLISG